MTFTISSVLLQQSCYILLSVFAQKRKNNNDKTDINNSINNKQIIASHTFSGLFTSIQETNATNFIIDTMSLGS